jgi:hypothetical protein
VKTDAKRNSRQRVRRARQVLSMCVLAFVMSSQLAAKVALPGVPLHVLIFNYSGASPTALMAAEQEANKIFSEAGIDITWVECPIPLRTDSDQACAADLGVAGEIRVRILDHKTTDAIGDSVFGFTVAPTFVSVYYGNVKGIANVDGTEYAIPVILGCVIAHEIGHLLLGPGAHGSGIMQAKWGRGDLTRALKGQLAFTTAQASVLRANALSRHRLFVSNEQSSKQVAQLQ